MPTLNPDIRRAAAEQLISLASEPRFARALSEATLLHAILHELKNSTTGMGKEWLSDAALAEHAESNHEHNQPRQQHQQHQQQQKKLQEPSVDSFSSGQLPITCLQLLVEVVQHCQEARTLLLRGSGRSDSQNTAMLHVQICNAPLFTA